MQFDMDMDEGSMLPTPAQPHVQVSSSSSIPILQSSSGSGSTPHGAGGLLAPPPVRPKGSNGKSEAREKERVDKKPRRSGSCAPRHANTAALRHSPIT